MLAGPRPAQKKFCTFSRVCPAEIDPARSRPGMPDSTTGDARSGIGFPTTSMSRCRWSDRQTIFRSLSQAATTTRRWLCRVVTRLLRGSSRTRSNPGIGLSYSGESVMTSFNTGVDKQSGDTGRVPSEGRFGGWQVERAEQSQVRPKRWSRRELLVTFGALGAGASLLAACGPGAAPASPTTAAAPPPATNPPAAAAPATSAPAAASGTAATTSAPAGSGALTIAIASFGPERFDRAFATMGDEFTRVVHGFLLSATLKDNRLAIAPGIASKWGVSPDGRSWNFTVRKGVKFHDGTDLTVADVLWTLQHIWGPQATDYANQSISLTYSKNMDRIEQTGPDEITVTTKTPVSTLEQDLSEASQSWTGAIYPKRAALHDEAAEQAYDRNPIGAGIMRLVEHVPATSMTFERFDDYYYQPANGFPTDKRVKFQRLQLVLLPDDSTRAAALRAGQVDIAAVGLASRQQVEAGGGRLVFGPEAGYVYMSWFGAFKPQYPAHDKRVRQALSYAIDRKSLRDSLWGSEVMQLTGWTDVTPSTVGYSPDVDPFPFDLAKARQLLSDAGYPGGNGFGK